MLRRKKNRPTLEQLHIPDDISEAHSVRAATQLDRRRLASQAPLMDRLAEVMIDRQGRNHYIELLYSYSPRSTQ